VKPIPSLQFPEAPKSTAPHDRLHHEAVSSAPVSQSGKADLTARGARTLATDPRSSFPNQKSTRMHGAPCTSAHVSPGFPSEPSAAAQVPAQPNPIRRSVSRGELADATTQAAHTRRARLVAPVARLDGARSTVWVARARDAGGLRPVSRASITSLTCAWSEHEHGVFAQFPMRSRRPRCTAAHAWRHPLRAVAHAKCFLGTQSPACRAGRGATISPHGCPCDARSRTVISFSRVVARAIGSPRA